MAVTIQHIRPVAHLPLVLGVVRKLNIAALIGYLRKAGQSAVDRVL